MASLEPRCSITTSPGYTNTAEANENDAKSNLLKVIDVFKEIMNKSFKEMQQIQLNRLRK